WFLGVALAALATGTVVTSAHANEPAPEHAQVAASGTTPEADEEGAEDHEHHVPKFEEYNFFYGFLGEKDDVEPSILWRPTGTPVPFGAMLLNSAVLYWLLVRFAKKPIAAALKTRKANILRGMEEAGQMKKDAEARLADYEQKLATLDQEIERVRHDMREAGQSERKRILAEAKEKRARMERDARTLISQELKFARESLLAEMSRAALRSAEHTLRSKITAADQVRLAEDYLSGIKSAATALRGKL
ncbi:MAG TPA: ATP synthase F0 subunit B, partial [Polyangiaceae bacterium]|nr:ATP synthase F0 subunit B [Polyangiaceae bacterium]